LNIWQFLIQQPLINVLIILSHILGGNFGLAIIVLTVLINLALLPFTLNQIKSAKAMQDLQPKLAEIQKKYGKDRNKLAQEQMKLYKESGVKPAGCLFSMFIQMPVWIAVYQSIILIIASAPEALVNLSRFLYPWPIVYGALPLHPSFLGMDLANAQPILALLVGVTMWLQQKMSTMPSPDPKQAQQTQMMNWMMPLLFTFMALSFPAGLSIYWITSSIFRIVIQYRFSGWGGLFKQPAPAPADSGKKYLAFDESKAPEKPGPNIVVKDAPPSKDNQNPYKKNSFKFPWGGDKNKK
jgi:YidC/Oxa1 family membrane protein insertase